ncbi:juvenile hormone esterase-like isoform X2 [Periplaneta americana]|uniref:juvenile hormone esterase-like isoform X2 n=1 Tax=Periplaneta americana TaxID=6978 RepID=UPI0037E9700E
MPLSSCTTMLQLWCCCLAALLVYQAQGKCLVSKQEASVQGSQMTSRNGRNFCSFRGMPYAAPPVGPLRFKAPQPVDFWNKKWNATVDGPMCIQKTKPIVGQEDCLYLNVYTPLTTFPSVQTFPVIVYFHGGSMEKGSGVSTLYHPKYFLDKDIVLVTINYRLGVFGFISTGDDEAPGNFGLKDQVAALRWVRDNIAELGGDPNKVTLQGQSAGAQSINYHMFSPLSRGLLLNQADLDNLNNNFDAEAYSHFFLPLSLDDSLIPSVWKQITESYFANNHTVTPDNVATFVKMASDRIIIHTIHKAAQLHTRAGHGPIYFYNLAYRGKYSFTGEADYGEGKVNLGVGHTDDVIYFFKRDQFPEVPEDHPDREVSEALITLWTNFAIYGSPTPPGGDVPQGIEWQPINANDSHTVYMKFGHADPPSLPSYGIMPLKISMEQDLNKERMEFWDSLPLKENIL